MSVTLTKPTKTHTIIDWTEWADDTLDTPTYNGDDLYTVPGITTDTSLTLTDRRNTINTTWDLDNTDMIDMVCETPPTQDCTDEEWNNWDPYYTLTIATAPAHNTTTPDLWVITEDGSVYTRCRVFTHESDAHAVFEELAQTILNTTKDTIEHNYLTNGLDLITRANT